MAEEKKEFQFVTEVPKNVWGPEFEDIFVYPMYDDSKVAMEITVAEGVSKIAWEVIDNGNVIAAGSSDALEAGKVFKTTENLRIPKRMVHSLSSPLTVRMVLNL